MMKNISGCTLCSLYLNQKPVLDKERKDSIFFVGLSAKKVSQQNEIPLSKNTQSGMLIQQIADRLHNIPVYRTNLVKCLPLDKNSKLRYPEEEEIHCCINNFICEINALHPKIVFLLGKQVQHAVFGYLNIKENKNQANPYKFKHYMHNGIWYVPVQHPSYIKVYKRKEEDDYINGIIAIINEYQKVYNEFNK